MLFVLADWNPGVVGCFGLNLCKYILIFDHDSEEEAELQALQRSSSSSSELEEDEEQVRTDIIKFKKRMQKQQEMA